MQKAQGRGQNREDQSKGEGRPYAMQVPGTVDADDSIIFNGYCKVLGSILKPLCEVDHHWHKLADRHVREVEDDSGQWPRSDLDWRTHGRCV